MSEIELTVLSDHIINLNKYKSEIDLYNNKINEINENISKQQNEINEYMTKISNIKIQLNDLQNKIDNIMTAKGSIKLSKELQETKTKHTELLKKIKSDRRNRKINKRIETKEIYNRCIKGKNCWNGRDEKCSHGYKFLWEDSDSESSDINTLYIKMIS